MLNSSVRPRDRRRLQTQLDRVRAVILSHYRKPLTLAEIARLARAPQASASARIREVRAEGVDIRVTINARRLVKYTNVGFTESATGRLTTVRGKAKVSP